MKQGDTGLARTHFLGALEGGEILSPQDRACVLFELGVLETAAEQYGVAEGYLQTCLEACEKASEMVARARFGLGKLYWVWGGV